MFTSNHRKFHVVFDGPALVGHRMDIRDLAPSLVAIADLFTAANRELNGDAAEVRVEVSANFKVGSFGIDLTSAQHLLGQLRDVFAGHNASAVSNVLGILGALGFTGAGLIAPLRKLAGKRPVRVEQAGDEARVWITETEFVEVGADVMRLYRSRVVRSSLEKTLSPLEREGIDHFGVVMGDAVVLDIHADEVEIFRSTIEDQEVVSDVIIRKVLMIESVVFKEGNKWRVHDSSNQFHASIEDDVFLARIDAGERFGKKDVLVVDLRQVQTIAGARLTTDSHIVKVIQHKQPLQDALL